MKRPDKGLSRAALAVAFTLIIAVAGSRVAFAGTSSTQSAASGQTSSATSPVSTSTNSTSSTTTSTNSTSTLPHATAMAILYYSIPELVVIAFFAVGLYLIFVRERDPGSHRHGPGRDPPAEGGGAPKAEVLCALSSSGSLN